MAELKLHTSRDAAHQSVIETLEEELRIAKERGATWCVVVLDAPDGTRRNWSAGASVHQVIAALEDAKFEIMFRRAQEALRD